MPSFSIGIDLGTSNSVLAYAPLWGEARTEVLPVPQWDTLTTQAESENLPSFLYLPEDAVAAELGAEWIVGLLARRRASETPGRVVKSAKSWLAHPSADRTAAFLPWGSDALSESEKISPVVASAKILAAFRAAWNDRLAKHGPDFAFDAQDVTVTVPASFDAAAQRLTLDAAALAGFPPQVRLLEEPQAAFYWWLERHGADPWAILPEPQGAPRHVLVVDVGGGTSDFSLFEIGKTKRGEPAVKRVAVSDHILLGGDNIDLALAHLLEPRLGAAGLSAGQWDHLVARARALKERALGSEGPLDESFAVSIPARGSRLIAGSLSAQVTRAELEALVLDGFYPAARADDRPRRALGAIKEFGLPYAYDSAVTRHLADFLRGRPAVDAVLFNGGSLHPQRLRDRLCDEIGKWQAGARPLALENARPDLAVACGAAYSGRLAAQKAGLIEAGAPRAVFLETHTAAQETALVCILPHGAPAGESYEPAGLDLKLRVNRPVRFQVFTSARDETTKAGEFGKPGAEAYVGLPPLETVATLAAPPDHDLPAELPVRVTAQLNPLGLLQIALRSLDPDFPHTWPLEFNLRAENAERKAQAAAPAEPPLPPGALEGARKTIAATFTSIPAKREKMTAPRVMEALEKGLGRAKGEWSGTVLRDLWKPLAENEKGRALTVEHEEVWLILAGYLLRPGFGVAGDEGRIDALWGFVRSGLKFQGKRTKLQEYILWRRVAGGLSPERQEALLAAEKDRISAKNSPPELIRMAGSFERLGADAKADLIRRFVETVVALAAEKGHAAPYLAALGLLLNRAPFHAGPESVVAPSLVEEAFEALRRLDWADPSLNEAQTLFQRAARAVDDRRLDLPRPLRIEIAEKLQKSGVTPAKAERIRNFVPVERAERLSLYGEALPPGLTLGV